MKWFLAYGYDAPALRFARRLDQLRPGDTEAAAAVRALNQKHRADVLTPRALED